MAQRIQTFLVDDVTGEEATETIRFALDGVSYEIDLTSDNAGQLRDALSPWVAAGRRVGGRKQPGGRATSRSSDLRNVREWARSNGYEISDRGRVAQSIMDAYHARR